MSIDNLGMRNIQTSVTGELEDLEKSKHSFSGSDDETYFGSKIFEHSGEID